MGNLKILLKMSVLYIILYVCVNAAVKIEGAEAKLNHTRTYAFVPYHGLISSRPLGSTFGADDGHGHGDTDRVGAQMTRNQKENSGRSRHILHSVSAYNRGQNGGKHFSGISNKERIPDRRAGGSIPGSIYERGAGRNFGLWLVDNGSGNDRNSPRKSVENPRQGDNFHGHFGGHIRDGNFRKNSGRYKERLPERAAGTKNGQLGRAVPKVNTVNAGGNCWFRPFCANITGGYVDNTEKVTVSDVQKQKDSTLEESNIDSEQIDDIFEYKDDDAQPGHNNNNTKGDIFNQIEEATRKLQEITKTIDLLLNGKTEGNYRDSEESDSEEIERIVDSGEKSAHDSGEKSAHDSEETRNHSSEETDVEETTDSKSEETTSHEEMKAGGTSDETNSHSEEHSEEQVSSASNIEEADDDETEVIYKKDGGRSEEEHDGTTKETGTEETARKHSGTTEETPIKDGRGESSSYTTEAYMSTPKGVKHRTSVNRKEGRHSKGT